MTEDENSSEALEREILSSPDARCAFVENEIRRKLSTEFEAARALKNISIRELARAMETSVSQVQRLLHHEAGGSLTLMTLVRAADVLGLLVTVNARPLNEQPCRVVPFGTSASCATDWSAVDRFVDLKLHAPKGTVRRSTPRPERDAQWKPGPLTTNGSELR